MRTEAVSASYREGSRLANDELKLHCACWVVTRKPGAVSDASAVPGEST